MPESTELATKRRAHRCKSSDATKGMGQFRKKPTNVAAKATGDRNMPIRGTAPPV